MILRFIKYFYWGLILFFSLLIVYNSIPYYTLRTDYPFLLSKQHELKDLFWRISFYAHITGAMVCILTGFPQFSHYVLTKHKKIHIFLGKVYVIAVLSVACPSGFYMSFYANGGFLGQLPFALIAILWFVTTLRSYLLIRKKQVKAHGIWMIRSYALTLSAVTFRIYNVFFGRVLYMDPIENYQLSLWLSLIGNIIFGELAVLFYNKYYFKTYFKR